MGMAVWISELTKFADAAIKLERLTTLNPPSEPKIKLGQLYAAE